MMEEVEKASKKRKKGEAYALSTNEKKKILNHDSYLTLSMIGDWIEIKEKNEYLPTDKFICAVESFFAEMFNIEEVFRYLTK